MPKIGKRAPGRGSTYKVGKRWFAAITIGTLPSGNPDRIVQRFATKTESEKWLDEQRVLHSNGLNKKTNITIKQLADKWIYSLSNRRENTVRHYQWVLKNLIVPSLGQRQISSLTADDVQNLQNELRHAGKTEYMVLTAHRHLSMLLNHAVMCELIPRNVSTKIKRPKPPKRELSAWQPHEVRAAIEYCEKHNPYFKFYIVMGCLRNLRREEILGFPEKDFHPNEKHPHINITQTVVYVGNDKDNNIKGKLKFGPPKNPKSKRKLFINEYTLECIKETIQLRNINKKLAGKNWQEHGLVWPSLVGTPISSGTVRRWWANLIEATGNTKIRPYDVRSTWATNAFDARVNPKLVQDEMGHTNFESTQVYNRPNNSRSVEFANEIVDIYGLQNTGKNNLKNPSATKLLQTPKK